MDNPSENVDCLSLATDYFKREEIERLCQFLKQKFNLDCYSRKQGWQIDHSKGFFLVYLYIRNTREHTEIFGSCRT